MKRMFIKAVFALAVAGVWFATPAAAQEDIDNTAYGTKSAEFLLLGAGARGAALGGSFAAIANDVTALYWNPAGAALNERPGAAFSTTSYVAETSYSWVGLVFPFNDGATAVGVHGATFGFSDQPVYTLENPDGDGTVYSVSQSYVGLTLSQNFSDRFSAGISGKYIQDNLANTSASTIAVDFGTNFHAMIGERPIRASFVIQNLGGTLKHDGSALGAPVTRESPLDQQDIPQEPAAARLRTKDFGLPTTFRFGVAFDALSMSSSRVTVLGEFSQPNNSELTASGGLEWALTNIGNSGFNLVARGSYSYQPDNNITIDENNVGFASDFSSNESMDGLAFGGGLAYDRPGFGIGLDYAYRNLGVLGGTNYFSASLHW